MKNTTTRRLGGLGLLFGILCGCTTIEEFEGGTTDCPNGATGSNLWMLIERPLAASPNIFFGIINDNADDTWIVSRASSIDEEGARLRFDATIDIGVSGVAAETFDVDLERDGSTYHGTIEGESNATCDVELELLD